MSRSSLLLVTILFAAACSSQNVSVTDGGSDVDSGSGSADSGSGSVDAGSGSVDAGSGSVDAGSGAVDAGHDADAGMGPDGGEGAMDAGTMGGPDAGTGQVSCSALASGEMINSPVILGNTLFFGSASGIQSIALPNGTPTTVMPTGVGGMYVGGSLVAWQGHLLTSFVSNNSMTNTKEYGIWQVNPDGTGGAPLVSNEPQLVQNLVVDGDKLYWVVTDNSARTSAARTLDASGNAVTLYQSNTYIPTGRSGNMVVAGGTMFWTSQPRDAQADWPDPGVLYSAPVSNPQQVTTTKIDPQANVNGAANGSCYLAADGHSVYFDCIDPAPGAVGRFDPTTGAVTKLATETRSYPGGRGAAVAVDATGFYSAYGDLTRYALDGSGGTHLTDVPMMATDTSLVLDATTIYVASNYLGEQDTLLACSK